MRETETDRIQQNLWLEVTYVLSKFRRVVRERQIDVATFSVPAEGRVGAVQAILCNLRLGAAARSIAQCVL